MMCYKLLVTKSKEIRKMQKMKSKAITLMFLAAMIIAVVPAVQASTGGILINPTTVTPPVPPSALNQQVRAGGNLSLWFGGVTFSGGQFLLYMSKDGFAQITTTGSFPDVAYSAVFDVSNLTNPAGNSGYTITVGGITYRWNIGNNWVNGTIKSDIPGGNYFIKAFDGSSTSVAVTDTFFIVTPSFSVSPTSGGAGRTLTLTGNAFGASSTVNLTQTVGTTITVINGSVPTGTIGNFTYVVTAPDLNLNLPASIPPTGTTLITGTVGYSALESVAGAVMQNATFTENPRGLKAFGAPTALLTAATGSLYGNNTDFTTTVSLGVGKTLNITGNNFYPGSATILWDTTPVLATVTASSSGSFSTIVTIPVAGLGTHTITITDANGAKFIVSLTVTSSITVTPNSGPVGTSVTVNGFGFAASTGTNVYNATISWEGFVDFAITSALTNANGQFTATFAVPHDFGGPHTVTATTNVSVTTGTDTFTITPSIVILPSANLNNTGNLVSANMTGLIPSIEGIEGYAPNIDNQGLFIDQPSNGYPSDVFANETGDLSVVFVDAGFSPGKHVFSLYGPDSTSVAVFAIFTVGTGSNPLSDQINALNTTVTGSGNVTSLLPLLTSINSTVNANNVLLVRINGTTVTLQTTVGQVQTTLAAINANITAINGNVATLSTSIGTLQTAISGVNTAVSGLSGSISSVSNGVASVQTTLGQVQASLSDLNGKIVALQNESAAVVETSLGQIILQLDQLGANVTVGNNGIATIQTTLGTIQGTVTDNKNGIATIQTDLGTIKTNLGTVQSDVSATKSNTASLSPLIIVAIVLALVAAIAAIASIVLMRRKIAG